MANADFTVSSAVRGTTTKNPYFASPEFLLLLADQAFATPEAIAAMEEAAREFHTLPLCPCTGRTCSEVRDSSRSRQGNVRQKCVMVSLCSSLPVADLSPGDLVLVSHGHAMELYTGAQRDVTALCVRTYARDPVPDCLVKMSCVYDRQTAEELVELEGVSWFQIYCGEADSLARIA